MSEKKKVWVKPELEYYDAPEQLMQTESVGQGGDIGGGGSDVFSTIPDISSTAKGIKDAFIKNVLTDD